MCSPSAGKVNFKRWTQIDDFRGCSLQKTDYGYRLGQPNYFAKIKPITIDPKKGAELAMQKETCSTCSSWRASMATQTNPALRATVSLLSGDITAATTETLRDANKAFRFAKQNIGPGLQVRKLCEISEIALVAMMRLGAFVVVLAPKGILKGKVVLDWRSFRRRRVSRNSLNAESQACAAAMDSLEHLRTLLQGCLNPGYELQFPGELDRPHGG